MKEHCCTSAQQSPTTNERTYKQQKAWMEEVYPFGSPANSKKSTLLHHYHTKCFLFILTRQLRYLLIMRLVHWLIAVQSTFLENRAI